MRRQLLYLFCLSFFTFLVSSSKRKPQYNPVKCKQTLHRPKAITAVSVHRLTSEEKKEINFSENMKYVEAGISVVTTATSIMSIFVPQLAPLAMLFGAAGGMFTAYVDAEVKKAMDSQIEQLTVKAQQFVGKVDEQDERIHYHLDMNRLYTKYELPVSRVYDAALEYFFDANSGTQQNLVHSCRHERTGLDLIQLLYNWLSKKKVIENVMKVLDYDPVKFYDFRQRIFTLVTKMSIGTYACHQAYLCPEELGDLSKIQEDPCLLASTPNSTGLTQECNAKAQLELESYGKHLKDMLTAYDNTFKKSIVFKINGTAELMKAISEYESEEDLGEAMAGMKNYLTKLCKFTANGEDVDYCPDLVLISCKSKQCYDHSAERYSRSFWVKDLKRKIFFVFVLIMPGEELKTMSQSGCMYQLAASDVHGKEKVFTVETNILENSRNYVQRKEIESSLAKTFGHSVWTTFFVKAVSMYIVHFGCEENYTPEQVFTWIEAEAANQNDRY